MKLPSRHFRLPLAACPFSRSGFTMIEIALCLAIIGFALVAIIGVLPAGLNVQKDNREETIINQDAVVWMNAIRNGALGTEDLTNYVVGITNYWARFEVVFDPNTSTYKTNVAPNGGPGVDGYSGTGSQVTSVAGTADDVMTLSNGTRIIGLLSTPKYFPPPPPPGFGGTFQSNYVVAYVRAFSGSAVEKAPQGNQTIRDAAFTYKLIAENISYVPVDPGLIDLSPAGTASLTNAQQLIGRTNLAHRAQILQTNSHDLRLTFRWPQLPNGDIGNGRVTFRAFTGGWLLPTKDFYVLPTVPDQPLFFFQPSTYVK
jgi:prepilin-type N-terminal cleavage/methylation domain-containing protein